MTIILIKGTFYSIYQIDITSVRCVKGLSGENEGDDFARESRRQI